jgi:hypothetical protein
LLDLPDDPLAHLDKGGARLPDLARAARPELGRRPALAEALGGVGEALDRQDLVAQKRMAMVMRTRLVPTIQKMKISEFDA